MYNADKFKSEFSKTNIYSELCKDYDHIEFNKHFPKSDFIDPYKKYKVLTVRQHLGDKSIYETIFSAVPFFYLEFLTETNPTEIYDLGCGWNIFKKYIPNIVGIDQGDAKHKYVNADINGFVNQKFVDTHQDFFESVFSINALHFRPLSEIRNIVMEFYSMIAPKGRGWIALNLERMRERDLRLKKLPKTAIKKFLNDELKNLPNILLLDVDLACTDNWMDGNIHIIFKKP